MRGSRAGAAVAAPHAEVAAASVHNCTRWYLIHCKPRQEARALEHLERQSFECFRPTRQVERVLSGRRCEVAEPLFPSYLFIRLDSGNQNWLPIRSTRGVNRIVGFSGHPTTVADELIEDIRRRMRGAAVREPFLKRGEHVIITEGSFSQVEAIFVSDDGDERVTLLLNILGSEQCLSFSLASVRKIR